MIWALTWLVKRKASNQASKEASNYRHARKLDKRVKAVKRKANDQASNYGRLPGS